ncbi:GNAT family N-acetyltransferase [Bacillus sp. HU-1818]|uniref:GNAT family N-acetyltransferase n=1 Tax=Bacillus sp. HU-1818 TaxID=2704469 RepID=UPI001F5C7515|nr:GNAT family N-acetyltransferase [Bacillus sp. HU-1818]MCI3195399.1 GNAT family N-acetyltransferase [Bacillus sp. HU-1818]
MYTIKDNLPHDMISAFLQSKQLASDDKYEFSLCLLENSQIQGVILYKYSLWESQMLNKQVMNVKQLAANSRGQLKQLFQAFYTARQAEGTDFIFVRIPAEDIGAMQVMQQLPSSYFVGSLIKLTKPACLYGEDAPFELSTPEPGDTDEICQLSQGAFTKSRYFQDPYLSHEEANRIFHEWTRNNVNGRADINIVAKQKGEIIGYLQGLSRGEEFVLDLMAVKPGFEGKGIGFHLLADIIEQSERLQHKTITAGTQLHNVRAIRLYERMGFTAAQSFYHYHLWPGRKAK